MKSNAYLWTAALFLLVWEIYSLLPKRQFPPIPKDAHGLNYVSGIVHVHSRYSDGSGTVPEIADAARTAGMDFLVLTDLNTAQARRDGLEKAYGNLDLFVEMEVATPAGHALTFYSHTGARDLPDDKLIELSFQHFLGKETRSDLFVTIAHPSNIKTPWNRLDRFPEGMEVVNFDSQWRRELSDSSLGFLTTLVLYPFNGFLAALRFFQVYPKDFLAWDAMNSINKGHFALLGHDTRAKLKLGGDASLQWPGYLETFRLASNVVFFDPPLATDFGDRKKQIYKSIREGRSAFLFHAIHPFAGNDWRMRCGDKDYRSGEEVAPGHRPCELLIETPASLPYPKVVKVWKDGELLKEVSDGSPTATIPVTASGVYRLEVWVKPHTLFWMLLGREVPYVFYNPIYLR